MPGWRRIDVLVTVGVVLLLTAILLPAVQRAREKARQANSESNLRQIGSALENYHSAYAHYPAGGTFRDDGTPLQSWTFAIQPFIAQVAPFAVIDYGKPWDDPVNLDVMRRGTALFVSPFLDPSLPQTLPNGLLPVHYAPNEWILHRNSEVRQGQIRNQATTLLIANAFGDFAPFGDPVNWRDPTLPLRSSARGFGHLTREDVTLVLFADGGGKAMANNIDPGVWRRFAGEAALAPSVADTATRSHPYRVPDGPAWNYAVRVRSHKSLMKLSLSPDRSRLRAEFGRMDSSDDAGAWQKQFLDLIRGHSVKEIEVRGEMLASEVSILLDTPSLQRLDLQLALVNGDLDPVLSERPDVVVRKPLPLTE